MATPQDKLRRLIITRQIVYVLVATAIILPFLIPGLALPFEPSKDAKQFYQQLEDLEPGSHVLISFDYDPASKAELYPMSVALLRHCFARDLIPIVMTHWPNGIGMCQKACDEISREFAAAGDPKLPGVDYVFLGYRPGMQDVILNMGVDIKGAFEKDYQGNPTATMPALEGVKNLRDIDLGIDLAAGNTVELWIQFGSDRFEFPMAAGTTAVSAPKLYPFLDSDQLVGLLGGLRAAADYEKLIDKPGSATDGMAAQSATHLLLIAMILGANVWYFVNLSRNKGRA
ncbi:MAG: hypothetical protein ACYTFO_07175 [Planctomycetota bacterium]|jgi:hypothetical protein